MKTLKFREKLSKLILSRKKTITWRLFNNKNISEGDTVSFIIWETGKEFAKAIITNIKEKPFKNLTEEDKKGHEKFSTDEEMYKTYSKYYNRNVSPDTIIKIIWFKLKK